MTATAFKTAPSGNWGRNMLTARIALWMKRAKGSFDAGI